MDIFANEPTKIASFYHSIFTILTILKSSLYKYHMIYTLSYPHMVLFRVLIQLALDVITENKIRIRYFPIFPQVLS